VTENVIAIIHLNFWLDFQASRSDLSTDLSDSYHGGITSGTFSLKSSRI
jgi:hypothetical protein